MMQPHAFRVALALVGCSSLASWGVAQAPPDYDFQFATIGELGNAAYDGPDASGVVRGRGQVNYAYRISTSEISTAQWLEFVNTYSTQSNDLTFFAEPIFWGATPDPTYHGPGRKWVLDGRPNDAQLPVTGMSWRDAAMYCNWLTNGKGSSLNAIKSGAYDTATFITNANRTYQDQDTRSPGAKYWIPGLDEWLKAVHYDPNRNGPGSGGWWAYCNKSDTKPVAGLPGVGETSAGYRGFGPFEQWSVPLGSYPQTVTPWGLVDATGGASEWLEDWMQSDTGKQYRFFDGACAGRSGSGEYDRIDDLAEDRPDIGGSFVGLRIASSVPSPGAVIVLLGSATFRVRRKRDRA